MRWRKSSYSDGAGSNCIEVADLVDTPYGGVAIRDHKVPQGVALVVGRAAFAACVEGIRPGGRSVGRRSARWMVQSWR
ncbi:DUF397 domain-containing protein [Streptomyces sp. NPDC003996]